MIKYEGNNDYSLERRVVWLGNLDIARNYERDRYGDGDGDRDGHGKETQTQRDEDGNRVVCDGDAVFPFL